MTTTARSSIKGGRTSAAIAAIRCVSTAHPAPLRPRLPPGRRRSASSRSPGPIVPAAPIATIRVRGARRPHSPSRATSTRLPTTCSTPRRPGASPRRRRPWPGRRPRAASPPPCAERRSRAVGRSRSSTTRSDGHDRRALRDRSRDRSTPGSGRLGSGSRAGLESPDAEQDLERDVAPVGLEQPVAVQAIVEPGPDPLDLLRPDEVGLVEDHHVGRRDLPDLQLHLLGSREDLLGVDNADDAVEADPVDQRGVVGEREGDPGRLGDAARLQQDVLGPLGPLDDLDHGLGEVVADRAADAAVGEADHVALDIDHEVGIDVDRAEVVDQDADPHPVVAVEDAVEQGRLAGAEETGEHGHRGALGPAGSWSWPGPMPPPSPGRGGS